MDVNWYPGHMTKAKRELQPKLKLIDLVIEVVDARAPKSSINPDFEELFKNKLKMFVLNKSDMADPATTDAWVKHFKENGAFAVSFSATKSNPKDLRRAIEAAAKPIYDRYAEKGMKKTVRALVCGIPNVGKSAILNRLSGSKKLKEGNTPGLTRGLQWVRLGQYLELMDSPGLLWPKIENERTGVSIAAIGSIKTDILDEYALTLKLLDLLKGLAPAALAERYKIKDASSSPEDILEEICSNRGFYIKKGELDLERGIKTILEEFKNAKIGRISLEKPSDE